MSTSELLNQFAEIFHKCRRKMADLLYVSPTGRMVFTNVIFMITGIVTLAVGVWVYIVFDEFSSQLYPLQNLPLFYIWTGGIIIGMVLFLGLWAMKNTRHAMKKLLVAALSIVFIFHLSACIAGYIYQFEVIYFTRSILSSMFFKYTNVDGYNYYAIYFVDRIQRTYHCCGLDSAREWPEILNTTTTGGVPLSCCRFNDGAVYMAECTVKTAYWQGCNSVFGDYLSNSMWVIGTTAAVFASIQVLLIILVLWAAKSAKAEETEENDPLTSNQHEQFK